MSTMLAGASWAVLACSRVLRRHRLWLWAMAFFITLAQALTGGRMGYVAWGGVGLILCALKWRRLLPIIPVAATAVVLVVPGVRDRMLSGFSSSNGPIIQHDDDTKITSGRILVWPVVIKKIEEAPIIGYGRLAMVRTGLTAWAKEFLDDDFGHPHEAYLEMLLDNGVIGLFCIIPIYFIVVKRSAGLFVDRSDMLYEGVGGMALALVLALLFGSFGAQTFYPREGVVGMWAAIGVAMRVWLERDRQGFTNIEVADAAQGDEEPAFAGSARAAGT